MHHDVVTVPPTMNVEEAVALAQSKQVGALIVVENEYVVGICTTNDFFYRILNPILGIGLPGSRIVVRNCYKGQEIEKIVTVINKMNIEITNLFIVDLPEPNHRDLIVHLNIADNSEVIAKIAELGCSIEDRSLNY